MTYQQFTDTWNSKGCDFDGAYGFQCMDLAHQYAQDVVGQDFAPAPAAKDVWNQTIKGYDKIANTPDGVPQQGDIIIWGTGVGAYGHIAVFDHGDSNTFTSFDQNWPLNSLCHFQSHNYNGVLGWFHPQSHLVAPSDTPTANVVDLSNYVTKAEFDQLKQEYDEELDKLNTVTTDDASVHQQLADVTAARDKFAAQLSLCVNDAHHDSPPTLATFSFNQLLTELVKRLVGQ